MEELEGTAKPAEERINLILETDKRGGGREIPSPPYRFFDPTNGS